MLPKDIETEAALAYLSSSPECGARGVSRRRFLQTAALAGGSVAALAALPGADAWATAPIGPRDGVLILLMLPGGNDGLNTVVPTENGVYYSKRGALAIPAASALDVGSGFGFNPAMPNIHRMFGEGKVAVVQGVGYPNYTRSHFDAMDVWMRAWAGASRMNSGWVGRWVDGIGGTDDIFQSVSFGNSVPLHLRGNSRTATTVPTSGGQFGTRSGANDARMYDALNALGSAPTGYGRLGDLIAKTESNMITAAQTTAPLYVAKLPDGGFARQLTLAARLVNADLGIRVITATLGGFDTHAGPADGHSKLLAGLDNAVEAFWSSLDPAFAQRVTIMTFSEFGRELETNGSNGTDHGTASNMLLIGPQVRAGLHGQFPSLATLDGANMFQFTTDFRSVYATVLEKWLGADPNQVLGAQFEQLDLFNAPPGATPATGPGGGTIPNYPPSAPGDFVPASPYRVVDTRIGQGGPAALGSQGVLTLKVAGVGDVPPSGVTAVAMNVTAVTPSMAGFVTVWPAGEERPLSSNLNFTAGVTIPNLVVAKLNAAGEVSFYNNAGNTHLVVDIVGYFTDQQGTRLVPLSPRRIVDTRQGAAKPMSSSTVMQLGVAGQADVPADGVGAVLLNVTVTEPSAPGFVTVWPSGEDRPVASALNFVRGQTIPNLVVCKMGADGKVNLANSAGTTHLVADVVGYFSASGTTSRNVATSPRRLLDTRTTAKPLGGAGQLRLQLTGVGDVPATGVSAVVCNVTVTEPTASGFLTVWPNGESRPVASSLNFVRGQTVPNLVVCKVGADGAVCIFNSAGTSHVIVDVVGFFTS